jgi:hypothetical protein
MKNITYLFVLIFITGSIYAPAQSLNNTKIDGYKSISRKKQFPNR